MTRMTPERIDELVLRARGASAAAYCPYSSFAVGAALLSKDGRIFCACNVENASYGLSICAERSAVFQMVAQGGDGILAVAVFSPSAAPCVPCGACLQVLMEFGREALVIGVGEKDVLVRNRVSDLLTVPFSLSSRLAIPGSAR